MAQYNTAAHQISIPSSIQWLQLVRTGKIRNTSLLNHVLDDLKDLQKMEEALAEKQSEINKNTDLSDVGRRRQLRQLAEQKLKPRVEKIKERVEHLTEGRKNLLEKIQGYENVPDATDSRSAIREQEIREYFRGKSASEVLSALQQAEKDGDYETLRALESAPASIMPEPQEHIQQFKHERLRRRFPDDMQLYEDRGDALEVYQTAYKNLQERLEQIRQATPKE